ncbi:Ribonuclease P 40kDa (Rpp40) subunit [Nesidiocoris tenuis]|uniref:Ribonuclease P 40kDa (Rpp40) subunit n=1 Tax=Nesidiocoris tenuis TaxID=355587 RepID=A0ABN7ACC8_9HEMI|nr:Ribonuclease P 40kDa (Rpp40) subunit [Nesidiocoris tenuis]
MENPNVWTFEPHPVRTKYCETRIDCPIFHDAIQYHPYNHSVWLLFADTFAVPQDIKEVLTVDTTYYKISDLPIYRLVEQNFINAFVKTGETTLLSVDRHLDTDSVFALTPDGFLILSLSRDEFLSLGIEKSPAVSVIEQQKDNKFHIQINLKESCFVRGKKNYERVLSRLKLAVHLRGTFVCCWEPPDENTCPSSLAHYFDRICDLQVDECNLRSDQRVHYGVSLPQPTTSHAEVFEWLAFQSMGFNQNCGITDMEYLSSYTGPETSKKTAPLCVLSWTGLITANRLLTLFERIKKYINTRASIPLIGVQIIGFDDAPISWKLDIHYRLTNGDNNLALAIFGNGKVIHCINYVFPFT